MKMKKVLAAVLAGTMVMASASMVFASETVSGTTWWTDTQTSSDITLSGEGAWTLTLTCDALVDSYGAFSVELYDANGYYITSGSDMNIWTADSNNDNAAFGTANSVPDTLGYQLTEGQTYNIKITREADKVAIHYYDGDTKFSNTNITDFTVTMADDLYLHVIAQVGTYTIVSVTDDNSGEYVYGGETASTDDSEDSSEDASEEASEAASAEEASEAASESTTTTTSDDNGTSTTTTQTGDAAPIAAVAVALIGCAAIAFASKKRFA